MVIRVVQKHAFPEPTHLPGSLKYKILRSTQACEARGEQGAENGQLGAQNAAHECVDRRAAQKKMEDIFGEDGRVVGVDETHGEVGMPRERKHAKIGAELKSKYEKNKNPEVYHPKPPWA
mmetsp:Transcript_42625/g.76641  ORF Transcript_42625/g.76641 Transcript_42625/m.76641 type:complete len:120 (-) Transcript_42625:64-423(-)